MLCCLVIEIQIITKRERHNLCELLSTCWNKDVLSDKPTKHVLIGTFSGVMVYMYHFNSGGIRGGGGGRRGTPSEFLLTSSSTVYNFFLLCQIQAWKPKFSGGMPPTP